MQRILSGTLAGLGVNLLCRSLNLSSVARPLTRLFLSLAFIHAEQRANVCAHRSEVTAVGFEPTPLRTGA